MSFDLAVFELFAPLSCGGTAILVESLLQLRESSAAARVTLINTVPSVMRELLGLRAVPASVQTVTLAGEFLPVDLVQEIYGLPGVRKVYDLYGPTETTTYSTFTLRQAGAPPTIGRPIANTQIYILDAHLQPAPVGVTGEVCIGGDGLARGYLNRPELTAEKFIAHPFRDEPGARIYRSGDLARYRPDGNIEFLGRADHQVKIRGFRIEPGEIEAALEQHPGVSQCAMAATADSAGEKRLVAYVSPADPRNWPSIAELRDFLKQKLPGYMQPGAFVILPNLPVTPNGKIDRKALPQPDRSRAGMSQSYAAPRTPTEGVLAEIWSEVLGLKQIGVEDDFFELGGNSLSITRVASRVQGAFGVEIPLRTLFEEATIDRLAERVDSAVQAATPIAAPILPVSRRGTCRFPLPRSACGSWIG
jgi:acyl-coenzyme A synthetase/AMP-(fatty) acid ligase/acyl carrier protein